MEARAFAELLSHIETSVQEGTFLFKFSELRALYETRLSYLKKGHSPIWYAL